MCNSLYTSQTWSSYQSPSVPDGRFIPMEEILTAPQHDPSNHRIKAILERAHGAMGLAESVATALSNVTEIRERGLGGDALHNVTTISLGADTTIQITKASTELAHLLSECGIPLGAVGSVMGAIAPIASVAVTITSVGVSSLKYAEAARIEKRINQTDSYINRKIERVFYASLTADSIQVEHKERKNLEAVLGRSLYRQARHAYLSGDNRLLSKLNF